MKVAGNKTNHRDCNHRLFQMGAAWWLHVGLCYKQTHPRIGTLSNCVAATNITSKVGLHGSVRSLCFSINLWMVSRTHLKSISMQHEIYLPEFAQKKYLYCPLWRVAFDGSKSESWFQNRGYGNECHRHFVLTCWEAVKGIQIEFSTASGGASQSLLCQSTLQQKKWRIPSKSYMLSLSRRSAYQTEMPKTQKARKERRGCCSMKDNRSSLDIDKLINVLQPKF